VLADSSGWSVNLAVNPKSDLIPFQVEMAEGLDCKIKLLLELEPELKYNRLVLC
jgi:hypothetical protein